MIVKALKKLVKKHSNILYELRMLVFVDEKLALQRKAFRLPLGALSHNIDYLVITITAIYVYMYDYIILYKLIQGYIYIEIYGII